MAALPPSSPSCLDLTIPIPGDGSNSVVKKKNLIDMNAVPTEGDEDWLMMSADTTRSINDTEDEDRSIIIISAAASAGVGSPPKKLRLSNEQSCLLEESFRLNHTLNPKQKEVLAMHLKLKPRQIEVWFQNRRARSKLKQTELEYQHLKKWFGSLTEQNRRLQKEVEELRSLSSAGPRDVLISPNDNEPIPAVSAQTVCPRCERRVSTPAFSLADKGPSSMPLADAAPAATVSFKPPPDPQRHLRQPSAASS